MQANDFTRNDCQLGHRRVSYDKLQREYRCNDCSGRLVLRWSDLDPDYPEHWRVECASCKSKRFVHECQYQRQQAEAKEVLDGLPPELATAMGYKREEITHEPVLFSLSPPEPIEL